ncbi:MAG: hypothetical protein KME30_12390 [Iphinoe sp. HA4291-MV1]|jgi:hypothetical protein|nr:hypothetical protein [Iphinoe sp. HA4291-MV1]
MNDVVGELKEGVTSLVMIRLWVYTFIQRRLPKEQTPEAYRQVCETEVSLIFM